MTDALRHRGPDHLETLVEPGVAFGHTRLSVIDLSSEANQPMTSADGRFTIVYNGEIYNFRRLRHRLEGVGHSFRTRSDTEVVLAAFAHWGASALRMFNGMFALAVWDRRDRRLTLARDRFGIKPLYYHRRDGLFVFGSEIKAILASGVVSRAIDPAALHQYLVYGNPHAPRTMYAGIAQLAPGTYLTIRDGELSTMRYWSVGDVTQVEASVEDARAHVRELLRTAVEDHLVSDVPLGVFLSGGVDSSAITLLAAQRVPGRLKTYSVGFDFEQGVDELPKARLVAELAGTDHHELHIKGGDLPEVIEALLRAHDQPFADAANIPLFLLARQLRNDVTVVLQGDGGDEMFAGYRRYALLRHSTALKAVCRPVEAVRRALGGRPLSGRLGRMLECFGQADDAMMMALLLTLERPTAPPTRVLSPELRESVEATDPYAEYRDGHRCFEHLDPAQRMLHIDASILLPHTFLEKVDRATMAHGMEVRVPFLDASLSEYALGLPSSLKMRNGQKKWILRSALRGLVPDSILDGPKTGFGVPYAYWLRTSLADYMRSVLFDRATVEAGLFDEAEVDRITAEHLSGASEHGFLLYKLLNLALWHREYLRS